MAVFTPPPTYADVVIKDSSGKTSFNPIWLKWFLDLINSVNGSVFDLAALEALIASLTHNTLPGLQGGAGGERYHLTSAQQSSLISGGDSTLHFHASDRAYALALVAALATIASTGSASDLSSGTVPLARLSGITDSQIAAGAGISQSKIALLSSGQYTPTLTNVTNLAASTAYQCQYIRVGSTVTVSGSVDVDPTAAGSTQLGLSLPIASNLGGTEDCAGVGFCPTVAGFGAAILGDAANNRAQLEWIAVSIVNNSLYFTFSYEVI